MGIDEAMFSIAEEYIKEEQDIYIVFINNDCIMLSADIKDKSLLHRQKSDFAKSL